MVVDYPEATDIYKADSTKKAFEKAGVEFDVTAVPLGQADMTLAKRSTSWQPIPAVSWRSLVAT